MSIKWTKSGYGFNGTLPGDGINRFKIFEPGDPCNYGKGYELLDYNDAGDRLVRTQHPNLEAAKRAARRHVEGPRKRKASSRLTWKEFKWSSAASDNIGVSKSGVEKWYIHTKSATEFKVERRWQTEPGIVYNTLAEAKAYCESQEG